MSVAPAAAKYPFKVALSISVALPSAIEEKSNSRMGAKTVSLAIFLIWPSSVYPAALNSDATFAFAELSTSTNSSYFKTYVCNSSSKLNKSLYCLLFPVISL